MEWVLYLLLGAVAGTLAGLFGVGGGVIIVPILLFVFGLLDFSDSFAVHLAVGTSLACIVFTSLASMRAHHLLGHVCWPVWRRMTPGLVLGVATGSWLASRLPADTLRAAIALFLLFIALQMLSRWQPPAVFARSGRRMQLAAGALIGWASAFFGIGGGSLTVPFLNACGQSMKVAVGTSAACGLPIALFGACSYAYWGGLSGAGVAWATGYIYWPALLGISLASVPFSKIGAQLASRLSDKILRRCFGALMFLVSFSMFSAG